MSARLGSRMQTSDPRVKHVQIDLFPAVGDVKKEQSHFSASRIKIRFMISFEFRERRLPTERAEKEGISFNSKRPSQQKDVPSTHQLVLREFFRLSPLRYNSAKLAICVRIFIHIIVIVPNMVVLIVITGFTIISLSSSSG